eukprot:m.17484 g.17484  ORF g.17484 m.17484 type:complete len:520 (-) comp6035_c0_seq1:3094-4653(-)
MFLTKSRPVVVVVVGNAANSNPRKVIVDQNEPEQFALQSWRRCSPDTVPEVLFEDPFKNKVQDILHMPKVPVEWAYQDLTPINIADTDDYNTLYLLAMREILAGRPYLLVRCRALDTSEAWIPRMIQPSVTTQFLKEQPILGYFSRSVLPAHKESVLDLNTHLKTLPEHEEESDQDFGSKRINQDIDEMNTMPTQTQTGMEMTSLSGSTGQGGNSQMQVRKNSQATSAKVKRSAFFPWMPETAMISRALEVFSFAVLMTSIVLFIEESYPKHRLVCRSQLCEERDWPESDFYEAELFCTVWFTIEFLWRFLASPSKWKHMTEFLTYIDLISLLPTYIFLLEDSRDSHSVGSARVLRVARSLRILSSSRFFKSIEAFGQCLVKTAKDFALFSLVLSVFIVLTAVLMFYCEQDEPDTEFVSIPSSVWWATITVTTVGYGDMYPLSSWGKFVAALTASIGVILLAIPSGIFLNEFLQIHEQNNTSKEIVKEKRSHPRLQNVGYILRSASRVSTTMIKRKLTR